MDTPQINFYQQSMREDSVFYSYSLFQEKCDSSFKVAEPLSNDAGTTSLKENSDAFIQACLEKDTERFLPKISGKQNQHKKLQSPYPGTNFDKNQVDDEQSTTKVQKNCKNQTKNIPKNFGKAIIRFIIKNKILVEPFLLSQNLDYKELTSSLKSRRSYFHSINQLKNVWMDEKYGGAMRAISQFFLKKYAPQHIFKSRIMHHTIHLKYRLKLRKALLSPEDFDHLKFHY